MLSPRALPLILWIATSSACDAKQDAAPGSGDAKSGDAKSGDAKSEAPPAAGRDEKPPKTSGVAITFTVDGKATTLELSSAIVAARPASGGLSAWNCTPALGSARVVDFSIGDDAARKGELFIASVENANISRVVPGKSTDARFQYRHAGEPTPKTGTGTMVWDEGLLSGTAEGKGENGETLSAKWTCTAE